MELESCDGKEWRIGLESSDYRVEKLVNRRGTVNDESSDGRQGSRELHVIKGLEDIVGGEGVPRCPKTSRFSSGHDIN